jgi:hypothetical protein
VAAAHVQASVVKAAQTKMPEGPPAVRPLAPHVRNVLAGLSQAKTAPGTGVFPGHLTAPHVQAASAQVTQAKPAPVRLGSAVPQRPAVQHARSKAIQRAATKSSSAPSGDWFEEMAAHYSASPPAASVPASAAAAQAPVPASSSGAAPASAMPVAAEAKAEPPELNFDGRYNILIHSGDKDIARLTEYPEVAMVIGNRDLASLGREYKMLEQLRTAVPLCSGLFILPTNVGKRPAFQMRWIEGHHSKTAKSLFQSALESRSSSPSQRDVTVASLQQVLADVRAVNGIRDFQVMLETSTGKVYVLDPAELGVGLATCERMIGDWLQIATGKKKATKVSEHITDKFD